MAGERQLVSKEQAFFALGFVSGVLTRVVSRRMSSEEIELTALLDEVRVYVDQVYAFIDSV